MVREHKTHRDVWDLAVGKRGVAKLNKPPIALNFFIPPALYRQYLPHTFPPPRRVTFVQRLSVCLSVLRDFLPVSKITTKNS